MRKTISYEGVMLCPIENTPLSRARPQVLALPWPAMAQHKVLTLA